jgi:2',3'-cyclic-nucleotide 2'-phosphodiesterase (5'-nucleotidase family)
LSQVPSVLVDTGYFMSDERSAHERLRPDAAAKDDWVLKAYEQTNIDVVNVSSHDLRYFSSALAKPEFTRRAGSEPLLERLVSANTVSETPAILSPRPFIVREVPSRESRSPKPVRVAFIGLTEMMPAAPPGLKFIDPAEAARRTVPEARKTADVVVALAKVSSEEAARIAREAPGIDVIIAGNSVSLEQSFTPPFYAGHTLVVFTPFETRMLGELRFYRGAQGKFTTRQRFIVLDEFAIPEDPAAKTIVDAAAAAESQALDNSRKLLDAWLVSSRGRAGTKREPGSSSKSAPAYVTSTACNQCHAAQYMKWATSAHARATDPLPPRAAEFETSCLECHATGSAVGTDQKTFAVFQNVQCEQCHGPGSNHVAKPAKGYGGVADMKAACVSCHSSEASPGFNLQAAWEKIKH